MEEPQVQAETQNEELTETAESEATQVEGDLNAIQATIEKLSAEKDEIHDQLVRTMADFQNFRKRQQAEQGMIRQYATESLVMTMLPVIDNFSRTVSAAEKGATLESLLTGVKAVEKQLRIILEQQGVHPIQSLGQPFDANLHEALGTVTTEDYEPDTVVDELETGYKMGDKVIRPARVRVSVKP